MPTLETLRLILRPMRENDHDALLNIFTDPKVMASFGMKVFTKEDMALWLRRNLAHQNEYGFGLFSVILKENNQLIGDCGLEMMEDAEGRVAELGYDFMSEYWHKGYATEAAKAVKDYAFGELKLSRLISLIRKGNTASVRVAERAGMTRIAEFQRYGNEYWEYGVKNLVK